MHEIGYHSLPVIDEGHKWVVNVVVFGCLIKCVETFQFVIIIPPSSGCISYK